MSKPVVYIDLVKAKYGRQKWRWVALNAGNQKILARSSERYFNRGDCLAAIEQLFGEGSIVYKREAEVGNQLLRHPEPWPAS